MRREHDVSDISAAANVAPVEFTTRPIAARVARAFDRYDINSLVSLLHEDAVMSMPPYDFWLRGPVEMVPRERRRVSGFAPGGDGGHRPFALQVIEISADRIVGQHNFLDTKLFAVFGLPARLTA